MIKEFIALEVRVEGEQNHDLFIGVTGGRYQLCGFRPSSMKAFFSDREECQDRNYGTVYLPEGKKSFSELVKGDILSVKRNGEPSSFDGATYLRHI